MSTFRFTLLIALAAASAMAQDSKVRVYITDSGSWSMSGGFGISDGAGGGGASGGARPQTAEIMKTFHQREDCQGITVTRFEDKADYVVILDHEGGKSIIRRDNKVAVFNKEGDLIYSKSSRSLGNTVKNACRTILAGR